ncbi:Sugar transport protein [Actinidia chinensis var. chinensis]|uniref:Sugar transport protein n=1 Tax=Actinidia chinensis var. chinensis TaxID=1590841 RepID=A0A2R6RV46_ACTCC|nr:Sugar transport protein [Actinidia chinensis var. chinensis]
MDQTKGRVYGGVTDVDDFLIKFFPKVHWRKLHAKENNYCKYDDQLLWLFTSSWYLAALVASFSASTACTILGRKLTILVASGFFLAGAGFSTGAEHKWMLILGRILFGIGVGFGNEIFQRLMGSADPISLYVSPPLLVWNRLMNDNHDGPKIQEMA